MKYQIVAVVDAESLGSAITAIQPHLSDPLQVAPIVVDTVQPRRVRDPRSETASQTRCGRAALDALRTGPCTLIEVSSHLEHRGFSQNSSSPILSKLIQEGLVVRGHTSLNGAPTKIYSLTEAGTAKAAQGASKAGGG